MTGADEKRVREQIDLHRELSRVYTEQRYAPDYSRIYQEHWNRVLLDLAGQKAGDRILDFGCGTGILFPGMLARELRVIGLDVSAEMLNQAPATGNRGGLLRADGRNIPLATGRVDCVICRGSIHHLSDREGVLAEIARVLKPGGVLAFSEPSNDSLLNRAARWAMYRAGSGFHEDDEGFLRAEVLPALDRAGFDVVISRGFGFAAYTLAGFPDKLPLLARVPGRCRLTRALIALDRLLEAIPGLGNLALHWQVRAVRRPAA
ncbi:MAG TPA: class I SAM-dependent methyltransferase [Polyangia bacterium]|nr:class I SAM-dependent methyltransferase [Polyangia bacterium]